jgi:SAM-dependent methyltransferase
MGKLVAWLDRKLYPHHGPNWDDLLFRQHIKGVLDKDCHLLDLGAGAGIVKQMNFSGCAALVCGIDPDDRVRANPYLDEGRTGVGEAIPYPDQSFHVVFADNVLEHLEHPEAVFKEVARVLKPGGLFLAKTPNRWHYLPLVARATPHRFHQFVNRLRGRQSVDTFPTRYLVNTPGAIQHYAAKAGLAVRQVLLVEGRPEYLRITAPTYLLGWLYERMVNSSSKLARFRVVLIAILEKPKSAQS